MTVNNVQIRPEQIRVGQVLDEDQEWLTLKIAKSDTTPYELKVSTAFVTLVFLQSDGKGGVKSEFPWETWEV